MKPISTLATSSAANELNRANTFKEPKRDDLFKCF